MDRPAAMKPVHFKSSAEFRSWLESHHANTPMLLAAFYYKASGREGLTYPEALDEALCFGWIDGLRKRLDAESYTIRFSRRKPGSIWSNVNVRHANRLIAAGRMQPGGLAAFAARDPKKTGVYSFEVRPEQFPARWEKAFRAKKRAWEFWSAQPPGYRRLTIRWVTEAKQEETQQRRFSAVVAESAAGRRIDFMKPPAMSRGPR